MRLLKLVPDDTNIHFLKWRVPFFVVSGILVAASWLLVLTQGLNLGVDFIGGQMIRVTFTETAEAPVAKLRESVDRLGFGEPTIQRFGSTLVSKGTFGTYMQLLRGSYRADNLDTVMCRSLLSVDWQGFLYDCDFNQMLGLRAEVAGQPTPHLRDLLQQDPAGAAIRVADHCFGFTAGQGSSCGGALADGAAAAPSCSA